MKYSEVIKELEHWKEISEEADPEVVIYSSVDDVSYEIDIIEPCQGILSQRAIGITLYE